MQMSWKGGGVGGDGYGGFGVEMSLVGWGLASFGEGGKKRKYGNEQTRF